MERGRFRFAAFAGRLFEAGKDGSVLEELSRAVNVTAESFGNDWSQEIALAERDKSGQGGFKLDLTNSCRHRIA